MRAAKGLAVILLLANATAAAYELSPAQALRIVAADLSTLPQGHRTLARYVYVPPWEAVTAPEDLTILLNAISGTTQAIVRPVLISEGVYRLDLGALDPFTPSVLLKTWDRLASRDYRFYSLQPVSATVRQDYPGFTQRCPHCERDVGVKHDLDGKSVRCHLCRGLFTANSTRKIKSKGTTVTRDVLTYLPSFDPALTNELTAIGGGAPVIVSYDVLVSVGFSTISGGLYYELRGVPDTLAELFTALEINPTSKQQLLSRRGAWMHHSRVTGKQRVVVVYQGPSGKLWITYDQDDDAQQLDDSLIHNLAQFEKASVASEVIYTLPNGLHGFALFDGDGKRADSVPDSIAADTLTPRPSSLPRGGGLGTTRLFPGLSCFRCHNAGEDQGLKAVPNDLARLAPLDIIVKPGSSRLEALKLAALFSRGVQTQLEDGRRGYAGTLSLLTKRKVVEVSESVSFTYNDFVADLVSPARAYAELTGRVVDEEEGRKQLAVIVPPLRPNAQGVAREGIATGRLRQGLSVSRSLFTIDYPNLAIRQTLGGQP